MKKKTIGAILMLLAVSGQLAAQNLDYASYIQRVMEHNAGYRAAQLELPIAQSELKQARMFNDPTVSFTYGNNSDWDIAMGQSAELEVSKSFSLGKRRSRMNVAKENIKVQEAGLQDYERNLRADATVAYLAALLARETAQISQDYADNMQTLYHSDSLRHSRGDLSEIDVTQSRLESTVAQQECIAAQAAYRNALARLDWMMGDPTRGTQEVGGALTRQHTLVDLQQLLQTCAAQRPDIIQAHHQAEAAERELRLTRIERIPDIDLSVGMSHSTRVRNEEAPAPPFNGYTIGVSLPLPVSTLNRGEVQAQQYRVQQASSEAEAARHTAQVEVMEAYNDYVAAMTRADAYSTEIIEQARQVLDGKMYAYQRGETSLLEVLNAQHLYLDIQQEYSNSLYECMKCWVELNRSIGSKSYNL